MSPRTGSVDDTRRGEPVPRHGAPLSEFLEQGRRSAEPRLADLIGPHADRLVPDVVDQVRRQRRYNVLDREAAKAIGGVCHQLITDAVTIRLPLSPDGKVRSLRRVDAFLNRVLLQMMAAHEHGAGPGRGASWRTLLVPGRNSRECFQ